MLFIPRQYNHCLCTLCDVIKQNESELKTTKSQFYLSMYAPISELYSAENPIKIEFMDTGI